MLVDVSTLVGRVDDPNSKDRDNGDSKSDREPAAAASAAGNRRVGGRSENAVSIGGNTVGDSSSSCSSSSGSSSSRRRSSSSGGGGGGSDTERSLLSLPRAAFGAGRGAQGTAPAALAASGHRPSPPWNITRRP